MIAALLVVIAIGLPGVSAAQLAGAGSGSVIGVVRDETGTRVQEVTITISSHSLMLPRTMRTRGDGEYRFAQLPPGDYLLTFVAAGFTTLARELHVGLAVTQTIDVTLTIAPRREEVGVRATLDRHSAAVSQSFDARELSALPSSRSMGGLFAMTDGLLLGSVEVGGGTGIVTGVYGAYGRNNSPRHTIEGIVVNGLFGAGFVPDYGALEEVSVLTAAQGAEWATAGIHTDFVTKSGSNQYRGTVYAAAEHRRLQSSNVDAAQIARGASAGGGLLPGQVNQLWGNRDLNADAGGFVRKNQIWWYASGRYEDVSARLVNFWAEPYETKLTNLSGKTTYRPAVGHTLVLYGQRGLNHQPDRLDPFAPSGSDLSALTAINATRDSTIDQHNTAGLWKAEWNAISDSLVLELRAGQYGSQSNWTPRSSAPRFEDIDTRVVRGGNRDSNSSALRTQLTGTLTYFTQNRWGHHFLRLGGEALRFLSRETWNSGYPGNVLHVLRSEHPSSVYIFETPLLSESGVWTYSAYASDSWQVATRVTLTLGLRFDRYRLFLPAQSHPAGSPNGQQFAAVSALADWNGITPRTSAVFDVTGDGTTLLKFSYGRYRAAPNATLAFNANPNSNQWWRQYSWTDPNRSGKWEPGEEGTLQRSRGGFAAESMDPDLKLTAIDEAGAWFERTLRAGVALRTGIVWRLERFPFVRQNINQPFAAFTVPVSIRDRGPDGVTGTADDGPLLTAYDLEPAFQNQPIINVVRNVPGLGSEYLSWEIAANRQTRGRWTFGASYAYTWNGDQASGYSGQTLRTNAYPLTPNDLLNPGRGGRYEFATWTAKAHGTFEGPWRMRVTPVLRHQSGQPFGRTQTTESGQLSYGTVTLLLEPFGTRHLDHITLVDVRIERTLAFRRSRVTGFLDIFNCTNANPIQNAVWTSGPAFLRPLTIVPPRVARAGVTFDW